LLSIDGANIVSFLPMNVVDSRCFLVLLGVRRPLLSSSLLLLLLLLLGYGNVSSVLVVVVVALGLRGSVFRSCP
jgi:predicted neutral ceramidase superfamily lipid hydrolase